MKTRCPVIKATEEERFYRGTSKLSEPGLLFIDQIFVYLVFSVDLNHDHYHRDDYYYDYIYELII